MSKLTEQLCTVLADTYALYVKTQNFHWNVEGPHFTSFHALFEDQYTELADAIDEIAEQIRMLGEKAPGSLAAYQQKSNIKDGDPNLSAAQMIKALHDDHRHVITTLNTALTCAQQDNDEATADMLVGRLRSHQKAAWFLKSSQ